MGENGLDDELITPERSDRYKEVISKRQNFTVILENVHDPHNIGAVMRSCDAVGISEMYIVYTTGSYNLISQKVGKNASSGAKKYVKTHYYGDLMECVQDVRLKYKKIYGTHLGFESRSLYDLDLTESLALMFGNEKDGLSEAALKILDGNFIIPQYGMVQSNISVACAVSLFEASRQRLERGMYEGVFDDNNSFHKDMYNQFVERHFEHIRRKRKH